MGALLDLLLPAVCPLCRETAGSRLCEPCRQGLEPLVEPCPYCALPTRGHSPCPHCHDRGLEHIDRCCAGWVYTGTLRDLIGTAKAGARPAAVEACASLMTQVLLTYNGEPWVVPVPPAPGRRPGPHLATALARAVAHHRHYPFRPVLAATRLAAEQHRLNRSQRQVNVDGLFTWTARKDPPATVILIDDLITSGATVVEAARTLREAGVGRVVAAVLGRTTRH